MSAAGTSAAECAAVGARPKCGWSRVARDCHADHYCLGARNRSRCGLPQQAGRIGGVLKTYSTDLEYAGNTRAGIPQVISPTGFDQPDNGHRTEVLGVGRVVPRAQMSGATFAAALREQLNDPEQPAKLARYRSALEGIASDRAKLRLGKGERLRPSLA